MSAYGVVLEFDISLFCSGDLCNAIGRVFDRVTCGTEQCL